MIESLAAGTPVVALRRGSVPEILQHGSSGWICDDVDGMVHAIEMIDRISPDACRKRARHFSPARMTDEYLRIYGDLIAGRPAAPPMEPRQLLTHMER
jgi:glycosyltransferase involved in cell wall biosynthesis